LRADACAKITGTSFTVIRRHKKVTPITTMSSPRWLAEPHHCTGEPRTRADVARGAKEFLKAVGQFILEQIARSRFVAEAGLTE
jgi:hypothetical protein